MRRSAPAEDLLETFRDRFPRATAAGQKLTWLVGTYMPSLAPITFVVGYPRSGTVWVSDLVAEAAGLPFIEESLTPILGPTVYHGHEAMSERYERAIYVVRDGRDVMVSHYFYLAREVPEGDDPQLSRRQKKIFPGLKNVDNVQENLPAFIRAQHRNPAGVSLNWADHVRQSLELNASDYGRVRYESMLRNPVSTLAQALSAAFGEEVDADRISTAVDKFSFERSSGRARGVEDRSAFRRKGVSGDWKNYFTREAAEVFDECFGDALLEMGYESDRSWVEEVSA